MLKEKLRAVVSGNTSSSYRD